MLHDDFLCFSGLNKIFKERGFSTQTIEVGALPLYLKVSHKSIRITVDRINLETNLPVRGETNRKADLVHPRPPSG